MKHVCLYLLNLPLFINGYYLSPNELSFESAEEFCQLQCNSHLASIDGINDYEIAIKTISNNSSHFRNHLYSKDVWLGQYYNSNSDQWQWISDSTTDYHHWSSQTIDSQKYCALRNATNDQYQHQLCQEKNVFLCESCDTMILNKYVAVSTDHKNFVDSNIECNNYFGTNLASIHNSNDNDETKLLCQLATDGEDESCWIGLNDMDHEGNYKWIDDTIFDYGFNISSPPIYPWSTEFITQSPDCVNLWQNAFDWNDEDCNTQQAFICNMPSEICEQNKWNVINGEWSFNDQGSCNLNNVGDNNLNTRDNIVSMDIVDKNWKYVIIEDTFKITEYNTGYIGISMQMSEVFDNSEDDSHQRRLRRLASTNIGNIFYIGVKVNSDQTPTLFMNCDGKLLKSINITQPNFDIYHEFNTIQISLEENTNTIDIYLNNELQMSHNMDLLDLPLNFVVTNIGLQNNGVSVNTKALYIAGKPSPFIIPPSTPIPTDNQIGETPIIATTRHQTNVSDKFDDSNPWNQLIASSTASPLKTDEPSTTELNKDDYGNKNTINPIDNISDGNSDNSSGSKSKSKKSITFTMGDFYLLIGVIIGAVCLILCVLFCCLCYVKKILYQQLDFKTKGQEQINSTTRSNASLHLPQYSANSVDISLGENVLTRQVTQESIKEEITEKALEIEVAQMAPIDCKANLEIDCNVNEFDHLSPDIDQKGEDDFNTMSFGSNSTLYDKYCTKNGQCFRQSRSRIMSPGVHSNASNDGYQHSMNEGFVRRRGCDYLNPNMNMNMNMNRAQMQQPPLSTDIDSSISDLFGSVKVDQTRDGSKSNIQISANVFRVSHLAKQDTLGDDNEESETSPLEQNHARIDSIDGPKKITKKESVYM